MPTSDAVLQAANLNSLCVCTHSAGCALLRGLLSVLEECVLILGSTCSDILSRKLVWLINYTGCKY